MEGPNKLIRAVKAAIRARNALRGGLGTALIYLGSAVIALAVGEKLPKFVWLCIPVGIFVGLAWPLREERYLFWAGRRLGIGERLAAADLLFRRGQDALLSPLLSEIRRLNPRPKRLLFGRTELAGAAVAALLLGSVFYRTELLMPGPGPGSTTEDQVTIEEVPSSHSPSQPTVSEALTSPSLQAEQRIPGFSLYQDIMAAIHGLVDYKDLEKKLAQENLVGELADKIAQVAPGGITEVEQEASLINDVSRLREAILGLEDEEAAGQDEAIQAVPQAADELAGQTRLGSGDSATSTTTDDAGAPTGPGSDRMRAESPEEGPRLGGLEESAGLAPGTEPVPKDEEFFPRPKVKIPLSPTPGEGPVHAYIVPGIPGEPLGSDQEGEFSLSSQEVELIIRVRELPLELRGIVRRYFELITKEGSER